MGILRHNAGWVLDPTETFFLDRGNKAIIWRPFSIKQAAGSCRCLKALQEAFRVVRSGGRLVVAAAIAPGEDVKPVWEEFKNVTQPLRLRVFSETDLTRIIGQAGFTVLEARHGSLLRSESFDQLAHRATAPGSGWASFLGAIEKIFTDLAPQLEFKVAESTFSYRQFWVTLEAEKPSVAYA